MKKAEWVDRLNYLGKSSGGSRYSIPLDPEEMIEVAKKSSGLDDFGNDDWQENYYARIDGIGNNDNISTLGRLITRSNTLLQLRNRLFVIDQLKKKPEILNEPIEQPIFIVGNPRTGTSLLFELLLQDKFFRAPLSWEARCPVDIPGIDTLSRFEIAQSMNDFLNDIQPGLNAIHKFGWDQAAECYELMEINFFNLSYHSNNDYQSWQRSMRAIGSYHWHKILLQTLQHGHGKKHQWLLKCPTHVHFIDELFEVYPDARIIYTHRDVGMSLPSYLSLSTSLSSSMLDEVNVGDTENLCFAMENSIKKIIGYREAGRIARNKIVDIQYVDLMSDPVNAIRQIYAHFGLKSQEDLPDLILSHLKAHPKNLHGEHRYSASDFGLTERDIRSRFKFYTDHYNIKLEI